MRWDSAAASGRRRRACDRLHGCMAAAGRKPQMVAAAVFVALSVHENAKVMVR